MSRDRSKSRKRTLSRRPGPGVTVPGLATATLLAGLALFTGAACAQSEAPAGTTGAGSGPTAAENRTSRQTVSRSTAPKPVKVAKFDSPVEVKAAPGFRRLLFVVEQPGRVMLVARGRKLARPFLDIGSRVKYGGEEGLLSIAFPPDYRKTGKFYLYFTNRNGDIQVDEYRRATPRTALPDSKRTILRIPHPTYGNHNGGQMHFLGDELYISTGDGGGGGDPDGNAQDPDSLLGKLLRIVPRKSATGPYSIPQTNPFVGRPGRDEIHSTGLRNPFRWSFDLRRPDRPRISIADVGQNEWEEVNNLTLDRARGGNFGWSYFEGFATYPGNGPEPTDPIEPVAVMGHGPYCSVTGGLVVRDPRLQSLEGRYLFGDFCGERLLTLPGRPGGRVEPRETAIRVPQPTSFSERADRTVFITSLEGWLYRLAPGG